MDSPKQGQLGYEYEFMKMPCWGFLIALLLGWLLQSQGYAWRPAGQPMFTELVGFMMIVALRRLNPINGTLRFLVGCGMGFVFTTVLGS